MSDGYLPIKTAVARQSATECQCHGPLPHECDCLAYDVRHHENALDQMAFAPRKGDWIQTFTGKQFWPLDPRVEEIDILDIAAGVARDCRFGGHCLRFYTVAEHSVLMYRVAKARGYEPRIKRGTLLHDASEGLGLRDMVRPVKRHMPEYKTVEAGVMIKVASRFDFDWPLHPSIKALDEQIGRTEQLANMAPAPMPWSEKFEATTPLDVTLEYWQPDRALVEFLSAAAELGLLR